MNDFKRILDKAKEETNRELMTEIKGLSTLTSEEINSIASTDVDKAKLLDLLLILSDNTKNDETKNNIIKELANTSGIIIRLLEKLI